MSHALSDPPLYLNKMKARIHFAVLLGILFLTNASGYGQLFAPIQSGASSDLEDYIIDLDPNLELASLANNLFLTQTNAIPTAVVSAKLMVSLSTGGQHSYGATPFNASITFRVQGYIGTTLQFDVPYTLTIGPNEPHQELNLDLMTLNAISQVSHIKIIRATADDITYAGIHPSRVKLKALASFDRNYGFPTPPIVIVQPIPVNTEQNAVRFEWGYPAPLQAPTYPLYEIQMLRLFETSDAGFAPDPPRLTATVIDWGQATTITATATATGTFIDLTLCEGTGFYIWRVRPYTNFNDPDPANPRNWGSWSLHSGLQNGNQTLDVWATGAPGLGADIQVRGTNLNQPAIFYYKQFDEDRNWIYSRTFSDARSIGNGLTSTQFGEKITYATGLQQVDQTLARTGTTILASQTVMDLSGRAALNSLPVPVQGENTLGYIPILLDAIETGPPVVRNYNALDFDADATVQVNRPVDDATGTAYSYYSVDGSPQEVPSAMGYPFGRTVFNADGSVQQSSGPGIPFAFNNATQTPKTSKIYHLGTTTTELARIFGEEMYDPNTVHQVLTMDPNGVMSSSYVDKEGKTLATSLIKADTYAFADATRTLLPLPSEQLGTYSITGSVGANMSASENVVEATALIHTDIPGQVVSFSYDLDINALTEICSGFCTTCDYQIEFTLVDQQQPTVNLLEDLMGTEIVSPTTGTGQCTASFNSTTAYPVFLPIEVPGNYLLTRRITTNNPIQANTTAPTQLDNHLGTIVNALEGTNAPFQTVDGLLSILHDGNATLDDFFAELDPPVDPTDASVTEFTIEIGCTPFTFPVMTCLPCKATMKSFMAHLEQQYELTETAYNEDPDHTNPIQPLTIDYEDTGGLPILTYTGTGAANNAQFSLDQLESLIDNMNLEPDVYGYSCENLMACWFGAVSAYMDALAINGNATVFVEPEEDSQASATMNGGSMTLHIMDMFLKCAGKHIQGYSTSAAGAGTTPLGNGATGNQTITHGYLTHAYAFMQGPPEAGPCSTMVTDHYQSTTIPWHTPITFNFDNANPVVTTGWQNYYDCVLGEQMAALPAFANYAVQINDPLVVQNSLDDLRATCFARCEDRRESFEAELWALYPILDPNDPDDQATIACSVNGLVAQCQRDCNAVEVLTSGNLSYLGPQSALERVQLIITGHFALAQPQNGDCPAGFEEVDMTSLQEPDPATFPTDAQLVALLNQELNDFVRFAMAHQPGTPSGFLWTAPLNGSTAYREFALPGSSCNTLRMEVTIGWNGSDDLHENCAPLSAQTFECLHHNHKGMTITEIKIHLINGASVEYDLVNLAFGGAANLNDELASFGDMVGDVYTRFTRAFGQFEGPEITYRRVDLVDALSVPSALVFDADQDTPLNISQCANAFESPLLAGFDFGTPTWVGGLLIYCQGGLPTTMLLPAILSQPDLGCVIPCRGPGVCIKWAAGMGFPGTPDVVGVWSCDSVQRANYANLLETHRAEVQAGILSQFHADYLSTCADPERIADNLTYTTQRNQFHYTLYYYDRAGNLISTIPPEGVRTLTGIQENWPTQVTEHLSGNNRDHHTRYIHNSLGQVVEQTTPNGGTTRLFYDVVGRLRISQNAEQASQNSYSYSKYDALGRVIEAGLSGVAQGVPTVNEMLSDPVALALLVSTNPNFPLVGSQKVTTTYTEPTVGLTYPDGRVQRNLLNRVASSASDVDGTSSSSYDRVITHYSYDPHGNVEWLVQEIPFLGKNYVAYDYDLISGRVLKVRYNEGRTDQFFHRYAYDTEGRIQQAETSSDGVIWDGDAKYGYYAHGPLQRTEIGRDRVQGVDYSYTIQGWLKGINDPYLLGNDAQRDGVNGSNVGKDSFGMMLNYFENDFQAVGSVFNGPQPGTANRDLYNGNITAWAFNSQISAPEMMDQANPHHDPFLDHKIDEELAFSYHYDVLNRLRDSRSQEFNNTWATSTNNRYNSSYYYDANGNFTQGLNGQTGMERYDHLGDPMDRIHYNYEAPLLTDQPDRPDMLTSINEDIEGSGADLNSDHTYTYNNIGQMVHESWGTGSNTIFWNAAGKVARVQQNTGRYLLFLYDAAGHRTLKADVSDWETALDEPTADDVYTYYVRDAQGNPMATYERTVTPGVGAGQLLDQTILREQPIYGSSRLGLRTPDLVVSTGSWNAGEYEQTAPAFNYKSEVDHLQISGSLRLDLGAFGIPLVLPFQAGYHTEPNPEPTFTQEYTALFAQATHNTYRAEDLLGELVFKTHYLPYISPNPVPGRLHVQDASGNLVWNSNNLFSSNNTPTLSALDPLNHQRHLIFTMDALGKPYFNIFDRSLTGNGSQGEILEPRNRPLFANGETYAPCMAVIDDRTQYAPPVLYLKRISAVETHLIAIRLDQLNSSVTQTEVASYPALDGPGSTEMQVSPDGRYLAVASRLTNSSTWFPPSDLHQIRLYSISADHQELTFLAAHNVSNVAAISSLDFSPESAYLYFVLTTGSSGSRLLRISVPGLTNEAPVGPSVRMTEVRRLKGERMLCTNVYGPSNQRNIYVIDDPDAATAAAASASTELVWSLNATPIFSQPRLSPNVALQPLIIHNQKSIFTRHVDHKRYELTDHLGNVRSVISDMLLANYFPETNADPGNFRAKVVSRSDYDPFGSLLPGRNYSSDSYRFGFNGKENDNEVYGTQGTFQDYGMRMYDPRIARFISVDPLASHYPFYSPYQFASNSPIIAVDIDGLESSVQLNETEGDIAIPVAWPDKRVSLTPGTKWLDGSGIMGADGDGKIKVGHAGLILIDRQTGTTKYFDFGRYGKDPTKGIVRSSMTDSDLAIPDASFDEDGNVSNMEGILKSLAGKKTFAGYGRMIASEVRDIDFEESEKFALDLQAEGESSYGPFTFGGSNCARFVCDAILEGDPGMFTTYRLNDQITPSPEGNVRIGAMDSGKKYSIPSK